MRVAVKRQRKEEKSGLKHQLIAEYLPYVKRIVYKLAAHLPPNVEIEDLLSAGVVGLIEAIERYDPERDNKFITYAIFRIKGAILSELRALDFLPRTLRKRARELEDAHIKLEQRLGREVNDEEVAEELGLELEEYYQIKRIAGLSFISLEDIGFSSKEEKDNLRSYLISQNTDSLTLSKIKEAEDCLAKAIDELAEKEKLVISLYYWEDLTMKEIGKVLDITESRVSQLHSQAVRKLKKKLQSLAF